MAFIEDLFNILQSWWVLFRMLEGYREWLQNRTIMQKFYAIIEMTVVKISIDFGKCEICDQKWMFLSIESFINRYVERHEFSQVIISFQSTYDTYWFDSNPIQKWKSCCDEYLPSSRCSKMPLAMAISIIHLCTYQDNELMNMSYPIRSETAT